ncbi:MAG TPA: tRNA preQ1(34) S-adenosylmethionine ribosyltransferase-isomerase QueA [Thermomicrobiaceae bacterium]|nr:tRNA preQ1(34) S-adenosylmethionine ribosyltransferase-isomerase QueA [Thermomicrobiaceae bacterium]
MSPTDPPGALPIADFDFELPPNLIAQAPVEPRDASRLLVLDRARGTIAHRRFSDIVEYLAPGDLLVINDTRVLPARLHGHRETGGRVELLLVRRVGDGVWEAMGRPLRRLRPGSAVHLVAGDGNATAAVRIEARLPEGLVRVRLPAEVEGRLGLFGEVPLPPYIHTPLSDPERYQTVYATAPGSAAAPTAGLHFTPALLDALRARGVEVARVTLHVGPGTFLPVKVADARDHPMHREWYRVPDGALLAIHRTRERGGRVVAVGTTCCRTLESLPDPLPDGGEQAGWTGLMIAPGHRFRQVDALVTNFHLPRSTLMLLVSALAGRETILRAYQEAVREGYRFYSFGDAMLIL